MAMAKSKNVSANEDIKPADTPERRKFLAELEAQRRQEAAEAAARAAASKARGEERAAERNKATEIDRKQAEKDQQMQEAYSRAAKAPLAKGGSIKKYAGGGSIKSRGNGIAQRGKTRGRMC